MRSRKVMRAEMGNNILFLIWPYQNESYVKVCVKTWLTSWFYSVFHFQTFSPKNTHKFFTNLSTTMKFCQDVPHTSMLKVIKYQLCVCMHLVSGNKSKVDANVHRPLWIGLYRWTLALCTVYLYHRERQILLVFDILFLFSYDKIALLLVSVK